MHKILWINNHHTCDEYISKLILSHLEISDFVTLLQINKEYFKCYSDDNLWLFYFGYPRLEAIDHDYQIKHFIPAGLIQFYGPSYKEFMKKIPFMKLPERYNHDYIDNLSPKIMPNAVTWGVDIYKRYYIALRIYNPSYKKFLMQFTNDEIDAEYDDVDDDISHATLGQHVVAMFQRYTTQHNFWRLGTSNSFDKFFSGDGLNLDLASDNCIIPLLKQLQHGTHPTLKLV
jgi:hypothetical protein